MRIEKNILIAECTAYDFKGELERKKIRSWLKSVSAFANAEGGTLFFGVDNDARVVGVANPQKDLEFISEKINAQLDPVPVYSLNLVQTPEGRIILVLQVSAGAQTPYYLNLDGKRIAYVRRGNESIPATALLPSYKPDRKPVFESSREFFYTTIPNVNYGMADADFEKITRRIHPETEDFPQKIHPETTENITQKKIGKTAQAIIDAIVTDPKVTRKGLADQIGKSEDTVKYHLASLQERKIIIHIGPDNGGFWKVLFLK